MGSDDLLRRPDEERIAAERDERGGKAILRFSEKVLRI
jgi:hypothetical protein